VKPLRPRPFGWLGRWPRNRAGKIAILAVYVALIFFMSSRPDLKPPTEFPHADKLAHGVEYGILGWLAARLLDPDARVDADRVILAVVAAALVIGSVDELLQTRIPGRHAALADLAVDCAGAALAAVLWIRARDALSADGG